MVEIYSSWCKGLVSDQKALLTLKKSNLIAGIELYNLSDNFDLVKSTGLKYNQHNALREYNLGLENEYFIPTMKKFSEVAKRCKESGPSVIGFHTGYSGLEEKNISAPTMLYNTIQSINFLDYFLDKKILFETVAYCPEYFTKGNKEVLFYVSSPEFVKQILSKSRGGYLLDISHNYVSGQSKIKAGEYKGTIEDYFADLLRVCANETYQLHLNVPLFSSQKGYTDGHGLLKPREKLSKQILLIAKEILDSCPNMKVITLEMNSGLEAKMHAKEMVKQAKIVEKELLHK